MQSAAGLNNLSLEIVQNRFKVAYGMVGLMKMEFQRRALVKNIFCFYLISGQE